MRFNLLNESLLLVLSSLITATYTYIIVNFIRPQVIGRLSKKALAEYKNNRIARLKQLGIAVVAVPIVTCLAQLSIAHYAGSLPYVLIWMMLPGVFGISLFTLLMLTKVRLRTIAGITATVSILFSLLLINNYYRFFPTLGQVFNKNDVAALETSPKNVVQFSPTSHTDLDGQSIEGSLASVAGQPTDGKVYSVNIPGTLSKFRARTAYVYVPAIYANPQKFKLPVIVLTPGVPGLPENWLGSGLQATMDEFAKHHSGIAPLVFMVDNTGSLTNDTECVDSPRGDVETYLTVDVPNYIKDNFHVSEDPSRWAIGGLSMGGLCSIMLTLRHPDIYRHFLDFGGEIAPEVGTPQQTANVLFHGSMTELQQHEPTYLLATQSYKGKGIGGFFAVGNQDVRPITDAADQLSTATQNSGIETVYETLSGPHTFNIWQEAFKLSLPWVSNRIGATQCGVACL